MTPTSKSVVCGHGKAKMLERFGIVTPCHKSLEPQWFQGISFLRVAQIEGAILRNGARGAELVVPAR